MYKLIAGLGLLALSSLSGLAQAKDIALGVSLASDTNPFYTAIRKGIDARAAELGWKVRYVTANEQVTEQVNGVMDLVAQKVDGILISPIDATATGAAYEAAAKAKIPIISIARHANSPHQTLYIAMDEVGIGGEIAQWISKQLGGKGKVAMIVGPQGAATFRNLADGFTNAMKASPGIELAFRKEAPLTREDGLRVAQDILVAHPDVKAIYCGNDELALGAAQAVAATGKTGQILITGLSGIPPAIAAVKKGDVALTVELNPVKWGNLGVNTMKAYLDGSLPKGPVNVEHMLIDKTNVK
ncbi:MAG TPA: substrate-binding domain-containing protein [Bradyrhizobium sp.]|nr:substrate-binding domain-containing protein [Bradyrhizobium sp.]